MDWNDLKYLLALHRAGSLAAAARELGVTKATMSRRLTALEDAVGSRLFERKPTGVALTNACREAVAAAEEIDQVTAALDGRIASVSDAEPRGIVRLTAPHGSPRAS